MDSLEKFKAICAKTAIEDEPIAGATPLELSEVEKVVGSIPQGIARWLRWRNGGPADGVLGRSFWYFLSTQDILESLSGWQDFDSYTLIGNEQVESISCEPLPSHWVPFANWNGAVFLVAEGEREGGRVLAVDFEGMKVGLVAPSVDAFFDLVAELRSNEAFLDLDEILA